MLSPRTSKAVVHLDRLVSNFMALEQSVGRKFLPAVLPYLGEPWPAMMPVVKADAYGLGHIPVSRALYTTGARLFASGGIEEAVELSMNMAESGMLVEVVALLGFSCPEEIKIAARFNVIPAVHCFEQIEMLKKVGLFMPVALKFNSGMARLGFSLEDLPAVIKNMDECGTTVPVMALSHFVSADEEGGQAFTMAQVALFAEMTSILRQVYPHIVISQCNSGGIIIVKEIEKKLGATLLRPGLAMYGVHPLGDDSVVPFGKAGVLREALEVTAPVIARRKILPGESIGYGQTHVATHETEVAIIGIGYTDGFSRNLSSKGVVAFNGTRLPVLGRVSMQMTAVDIQGQDVNVGDMVHILGGESNPLTCNELAKIWQTTPHEVLCMLGNNLRKEYT